MDQVHFWVHTVHTAKERRLLKEGNSLGFGFSWDLKVKSLINLEDKQQLSSHHKLI